MGKKIGSIILTIIGGIFVVLSVISFSITVKLLEIDNGGVAIALLVFTLSTGVVYVGSLLVGPPLNITTIIVDLIGIKKNRKFDEASEELPKSNAIYITCIVINSLYIAWYIASILIARK